VPGLLELEGELGQGWLELSSNLDDLIRLSQVMGRERLFVTIAECVHVVVYCLVEEVNLESNSFECGTDAFAGLFEDSLESFFHGSCSLGIQSLVQLFESAPDCDAAIHSPVTDDLQLLIGLDLLVLNHDSSVGLGSGQLKQKPRASLLDQAVRRSQ
jgi:hypothetical protein